MSATVTGRRELRDRRTPVRRDASEPSAPLRSCCWPSRPSSSCRSPTPSLGGFKDAPQLAADPVGLPNPWVVSQLHRRPDLRRASGGSSATALLVAGHLDRRRRPVRGARGLRLRPARVPRPRGRCTRCSRSACCSRRRSRSCRCSSWCATSACSTTRSASPCREAAFGLPLTIIILRPFFRSIPTELEDAAAIDGCGPFGFFWRILLPLSRPALATVAVLAIVVQLEPVPAAAGDGLEPEPTGPCRWA